MIEEKIIFEYVILQYMQARPDDSAPFLFKIDHSCFLEHHCLLQSKAVLVQREQGGC